MCCSTAKKVAQSDLALNQAETAMTNTLNADYSANFANYEKILGQQSAKLNYIASNPMGYSPAELHSATTAINENTANAAKAALGSAAAFAAAHGGADIGGGATGMIAGQIGSAAAQSKAQQLAALSNQNQEMKRQNFWSALNGLNQVASGYEGGGASELSGASGAAGGAVNAGSGAVTASNIGWEDAAGIISGIGGLASAGVGAYKAYKG